MAEQVELEDDKARAIALCTGHLLALDAAAAATDHPTSLGKLSHYRGKVQQYLRWLSGGDCEGLTALGMLGPNGYGPGIEAACRSARYHGFEWQARREAMMAGGVS
jgi:hypothetical protein